MLRFISSLILLFLLPTAQASSVPAAASAAIRRSVNSPPASHAAGNTRHRHFQFSRAFAPSESAVAPPDAPFRDAICLNGRWQFQPEPVPADFKPDAGDPPALPAPAPNGWAPTPIKIPSPWNVNAFNRGDGGDFRCYPSYPASWDGAQMGWLRRTFTVPAAWKGKRLRLRFDAIAGNAEIYVNGQKVGENFDLFLPSEYDVTREVRFGAPNELRVGVRKASLFNNRGVVGARTYPGGSMWGQAIVGIWQDVFLEAVPVVHVADNYINPQVATDELTDEVTIRNDSRRPETVRVSGQVRPWINLAGRSVLDAPEPRWRLGPTALTLASQQIIVPAGQTAVAALRRKVNGALRNWSPDTPVLYGLIVSLSQGNRTIDRKYTRFGWRQFTFDGNHQLLNGKRLELRGDSWHFLGIPQMTRRYAWAWFKALKDAHGNAVRLHAEPYPSFYLDVADEMGVCVLDETALWGSDAGHAYDRPEFWTRANDHVRRLILRDRNHASVFGWSVSNEVAWFVDHKHPALMDRLKQGWRTWLADARTLDPSRPWVSTDGDNDADGIMPTSVSHYAAPQDIVRADKPYGEGETGGAYYATPRYAAKFVGPRAYESQEGRMEGIAIEAYGLIKGERAVGASYASVFNLVWYGLQPLELGLTDTTRPYTLADGIFFPRYQEGKPGVQPERLGPYCSTLNPGYDPRLPLYRPWPLADAIKAAYAPGGPAPSKWDHVVVLDKPDVAPLPQSIKSIVVLADESSLLPNELQQFGATVADDHSLDTANYIVIDGAAPPRNGLPDLERRIADRVRQGATCLILGATTASAPALNELLPAHFSLTARQATSLLIQSPDPLIAGMDNGSFYFTESGGGPVIQHGLEGPLATGGRTILAACPTDWRRWNGQPEPIKTAATLRSEREAKPSGAALVESKSGAGRYLVATLDLSNPSVDLLQTVIRMMANTGVEFGKPTVDSNAALDVVGRLSQALACGAFGGASPAELYQTDSIGINDRLRPTIGDKSGGIAWRALKTKSTGAFDFKNSGLQGPLENAAVYLSFWVWSPRPLDNLLVEPNLPRLDLLMGSDDGCQIWLNSHLLKEDRGVHPLTPDSIVAPAVPLQQGWNHFIVKVVQGGGEWGFEARFHSSDARFLLGLRSSILPPPAGG
ncbi:MAG TPA: glycoside hydrolase family 2 TIM barrel-domain containing protein [Armatimonadota bacterium]|nr:glycoside hydrolase family 2 TIM barrel-domain containing protein [Armatimonadota bacterium]